MASKIELDMAVADNCWLRYVGGLEGLSSALGASSERDCFDACRNDSGCVGATHQGIPLSLMTDEMVECLLFSQITEAQFSAGGKDVLEYVCNVTAGRPRGQHAENDIICVH